MPDKKHIESDCEGAELVAMIQTGWPKIRVGLYRLRDGQFRYIEEGLRLDETGEERWVEFTVSDIYEDKEKAKASMLRYYCDEVEDEYEVEPSSVAILEAPDFSGYRPAIMKPRSPGKS